MNSYLVICWLRRGKGEGGGQCGRQMVVSFTGLETQIGNRFEAGDNEFSFGHGELGTQFLLLGIF